jgi:hypothetical protein
MTDEFARLHPDGAPGVADQFSRQLLGDAGYEKWKAEKAAQVELQVRWTKAKIASERARGILVAGIGVALMVVSFGGFALMALWILK